MRRLPYFLTLLLVLLPLLLIQGQVSAAGMGISPTSVEFDVPANGSTDVDFKITNFNGNLEISLEDIPLKVEPTSVPVDASAEGTKITLTFYGDESIGSEVYTGKIRFLAMTGGAVSVGLKVKATVNHIPAEPEQGTEAQTAAQGKTTDTSTRLIKIISLCIILIIVVVLITMILRRRSQ